MANRVSEGSTRLHVDLPSYLLDAFKAYAARRGLTIRQALCDMIAETIDKDRAGPKATNKEKYGQDWTEIIDWVRNKA